MPYPVKFVTTQSVSACGICLEPGNQPVAHLIKGKPFHLYCLACITEWAKVKPTCPECRMTITSINQKNITTTHSLIPITACHIVGLIGGALSPVSDITASGMSALLVISAVANIFATLPEYFCSNQQELTSMSLTSRAVSLTAGLLNLGIGATSYLLLRT